MNFIKLDTSRKRIALVTSVMALLWGAIILCRGLRGTCYSADWTLMSEVGRRLALGGTLYVDAIDQKGPLCYAAYALVWQLAHTQVCAYVVSNVLAWAMLVASTFVSALMVEESRRPWAHLFVQALLTAVILVPHVGCIELWLAPFGLLAALWIRRLARGETVPDVCWVVVGLAAAFSLWAKFTCCAQFVFLLCYGAAQENTRGLGRAVAIALGTCVLASVGVLVWMWQAGSFDAMMEHYIYAASNGYAERMSLLDYLTEDNLSTTHALSFFVGMPVALWAIGMTARTAKRRLLVVVGGGILVVCCFATFVGYYRFQLAALAVLGACEMTGEPWEFPPARLIDKYIGRKHVLLVASMAAIVAATVHACNYTLDTMQDADEMRTALHDTVGDDDSVLVWQFSHTWVFGELGLDYPYAMAARYNASQDTWDSTAGADVDLHKWRYIVVSIEDGTVEKGDTVTVSNTKLSVLATSHNMAVVDGAATPDALSCEPYRLP